MDITKGAYSVSFRTAEIRVPITRLAVGPSCKEGREAYPSALGTSPPEQIRQDSGG